MSTRTRKKRKQREEQYGSFRKKIEKRGSSDFTRYLKMPDGAKLLKPKAGKMLLDVLAYRVGAGNPAAEKGWLWAERTFFVHRNIGPDNAAFLCPAKTLKKPCPVCEHRKSLDPEEDEKLIKELAPKERQLWNVIDLKNPDDGVQLLDISYHLFGRMVEKEIENSEEEDEWDMFATYDKGLTLRVNWVEESFGGRSYFEAGSVNFRPRRDEYDKDEWLEQVFCLDELLVETPYKELKAALLQTDTDEEDEEEEDEKPRRGKKKAAKKSSRKKPEPEEEEDEEEEDDVPWDDDEEEEEEEKPKRGKGKSKPEPEEDEEEADEDEEWEDEEEEAEEEESEEDESEDEEEPDEEDEDWGDFDEDEDSEEEESEEEDEEEEEETPKPRQRRKKAAKKPAAKKKAAKKKAARRR